jgi:hypothetical protein
MFLQHHAKAFWACAALLVLVSGNAEAGVADGLVSHRAVYDLALKNASDTSGIDDMYGRIVYEFTGSACKGYNVRSRFVTTVDMGGQRRLTDQQTETFEDIKNSRFRFETKSYSDDKLSLDVRGLAHSNASGLEVDLQGKDPRKLELAKSMFPTEQMLDVIKRAREGKRYYETRVFDGSDSADKALFTTTVVGKKVKPTEPDSDSANAGILADQAYWPVTIAYFDDKSGVDELPTYSVSFKLYENGVTRDLTMDYGDFVLVGKLSNLEFLKQDKVCP